MLQSLRACLIAARADLVLKTWFVRWTFLCCPEDLDAQRMQPPQPYNQLLAVLGGRPLLAASIFQNVLADPKSMLLSQSNQLVGSA